MENLIRNIADIPKDKKLIIFDLDGTLTASKVAMDSETAGLFAELLKQKKAAVIGGGAWERFKIQVLDVLPYGADSGNLFILPLNGGSFYEYQNGEWTKVYEHDLSLEQRKAIGEAFARALGELGYVQPEKTWGVTVEDRGSQTTWSALGQEAPLQEKEKWNREENGLRLKIVSKLKEYLPAMEAKVAGLTSVDVTMKGIDKKFGIGQLMKRLSISVSDTLYVGDTLGTDGNDSPALESGVLCFEVKSPQDTKELIRYLVK